MNIKKKPSVSYPAGITKNSFSILQKVIFHLKTALSRNCDRSPQNNSLWLRIPGLCKLLRVYISLAHRSSLPFKVLVSMAGKVVINVGHQPVLFHLPILARNWSTGTWRIAF